MNCDIFINCLDLGVTPKIIIAANQQKSTCCGSIFQKILQAAGKAKKETETMKDITAGIIHIIAEYLGMVHRQSKLQTA